jgi:hypothetical protein
MSAELVNGFEGDGPGSGPGVNVPSTPWSPSIPDAETCTPSPEVSHVVVRRLNRTEYNNTVHHLLGDTSRPADEFPADSAFGGFDNNSMALSFNSLLLGRLEVAAEKLAHDAVTRGIIKCDPVADGSEACAREVLAPLARRAYRRTVTATDMDALLALVKLAQDQGDTFSMGIELAIRRILLSPSFLYRFELSAQPGSTEPFALDGFALASRLSYFLWSSMPDDALLAAAEEGLLTDPSRLKAEAQRMLADPKASALSSELARQWLMGQLTAAAKPEPTLFPAYDAELSEGLQTETALFLESFVRENLSLPRLMDADFTFANERVARHYQLPGVTGSAFQKVSLAGHPQRGGLLTQANIHVATGVGDETSPEKRGLFVLSSLLCADLPEPPPDALSRQQELQSQLGQDVSRREVVEARMAMSPCGQCHQHFDPIGLALENYDPTGAWRESDHGHTIDAKVDLFGLGTVNGPRELSTALTRDPRLEACFTNTFFRFALGRLDTEADACTLSQVTHQVRPSGLKAQDLVLELIQSRPFRFQGPDQF